MQTRFINLIGRKVSRRMYWGDDCPSCLGHGNKGYHNAETLIRIDPVEPRVALENHQDYPDGWPTKCDNCDELVPGTASRQIFQRNFYDTDSGNPEPGDLYYLKWHEPGKCWYWDEQCQGMHLHCILPNNFGWDIDSRASNCTKPEDKTHRCWVRHGDPPNVTVNKAGHTCEAGAGSIMVPGWHGFLTNGQLNGC